jgi:hypothetical protein
VRYLCVILSVLPACERTTHSSSITIARVEPPIWQVGDAPELTIAGRGFLNARADMLGTRSVVATHLSGALGGLPLAEVTVVSDAEARASAPTLPAGTHDLRITSARGDAELTGAVLVTAEPTGPTLLLDLRDDAVTMTGTTETVDVIPPVDPERTLLLFNFALESEVPDDGNITGTLSGDGSQVIFERYAVGPVQVALRYFLLELDGAAVRRGTTTIDTGTGSPVLEPLAPPLPSATNAFATTSIRTSGSAYGWNDWARATVVNTTSVAVDRQPGTGTPGYIEWQVVSFESWTGVTVQTDEVALVTTESTIAIEPVATNASFLLAFQTGVTPSDIPADEMVRAHLVSSTEVLLARARADNEIVVTWSVVTGPSFRTQHGEIDFAVGVADEVIALSPRVDPDRSAAFAPSSMRQGSTPFAGNDLVGLAWFTTTLSADGSELTLHRGDTREPARASWTVLEVR